MAGGVVADVDRHPRAVRAGALEDLAAPLQHPLDEVLPRTAVLLVRRLDRADVVGRADGDGVPASTAVGGVGERPLGDDLAHRVALAALGRALRVRFVGVAVLVTDRAPDELVDVGLGDHGRHARRDDDAAHGPRLLDAADDVVARALDVLRVVVGADVGDVGDAVAAAEDLVEAARARRGRRRAASAGPRRGRSSPAGTRRASRRRRRARTPAPGSPARAGRARPTRR